MDAEGEITELISSFANATFSELNMGSYYNFTVKSVGKEGRSNEIYSDVVNTQTGNLQSIVTNSFAFFFRQLCLNAKVCFYPF